MENTEIDMTANFWKNLNNLKDFWSLSLTDICNDLNKAVDGLNLTKGKLDYLLRQPSDANPSDDMINVVNELYCDGYGLGHDVFNICDNELNAYRLAFLVTNHHIHECRMDKTVWIKNFWSNYRWIEACYQQIGLSVPVWKKAGNYTYKLRKNHNILPPVEVMKEFGEWVGLTPYPMTYLKRLDGMQMLNHLIYIQNPSLKNEQYMDILAEEKKDQTKKENKHCDDEFSRDLIVFLAKKRFLWTNGFLSEEKYHELDWMIASLRGLKDDSREEAFRNSGKNFQFEFMCSIINAINEGADRLKEHWDKLNP